MIGKIVKNYKILEKIGQGGMGIVYKAFDSNLDRFVALKTLYPDFYRDKSIKSESRYYSLRKDDFGQMM